METSQLKRNVSGSWVWNVNWVILENYYFVTFVRG